MRLTALPVPLRSAFAAALTVLAALVLASPAAALEQKLTASDGYSRDYFGTSVAVDGDRMVVGAPYADVGTNYDQGAVYVYLRSGGSWTQSAKLTASDGAIFDQLGRSVAIDGDTIVAGVLNDDVGSNTLQGSVYTFTRTGAAARTETAKLTASDGGGGDYLGSSVAIDGDTIVAGAMGDDVGTNTRQGSVYTFARTGAAARTQTAKLTASDGAAEDTLGSSVAIDGETIVAGARGDDVGATGDEGSVYTFARTGAAARTQTAKLTASDGAASNALYDVAIDGETILAGAPADDVGANADQGSVYTFATTGAAARTETAKLTASDGAASDYLGASVAIDGATILAGARQDDVGANSSQGSVYTFATTGAAARTETARLTASDGTVNDQLGSSVAIDGATILAGAITDDVGANADQGSASVFSFSPPPDSDGDGKADPDDACPSQPAQTSNGCPPPDRELPEQQPGPGNNVLAGSARADVICGLGGSDTIRGLRGNDTLFGDACGAKTGAASAAAAADGNDTLFGGDGNDRLYGAGGKDTLDGGRGDDKLVGGRGVNRYKGGPGNDTIGARNRRDETVNCGTGKRDLAIADKNDKVRGCERVRRAKR